METRDINWSTYRQTSYIREAERFLKAVGEDPAKEVRLKKQQCVVCFNRLSLAGRGFTDYACICCHGVNSHSNTNTPQLCLDCAQKNNLCIQCAADIDLQGR